VLPKDLTIDGERLDVHAWRRVASCAVEERVLRRSWPCSCDGPQCDRTPSPGSVLGETWSHCPYPILKSPAWAMVVQLERSMDLGCPVEWPLGLAAWAVEAVYGLRLARNSGKVEAGDVGGGVADQLLANLRRR